jgi:hypothetical protein
MSKRITLTDFEVEQIINGLTTLRDATSLHYQVIKVGQRFYDILIAKLKTEPSTTKASASSVISNVSQKEQNVK